MRKSWYVVESGVFKKAKRIYENLNKKEATKTLNRLNREKDNDYVCYWIDFKWGTNNG